MIYPLLQVYSTLLGIFLSYNKLMVVILSHYCCSRALLFSIIFIELLWSQTNCVSYWHRAASWSVWEREVRWNEFGIFGSKRSGAVVHLASSCHCSEVLVCRLPQPWLHSKRD